MSEPVPLWDSNVLFRLADRALNSARTAVVMTQAVGDHPIVWANKGFTALTGYSRSEVLGRNPRFLQGPHTDRAAVQRMNLELAAGSTVTTALLNYRKDGTAFWNRLVISPICDDDDRITHHAAILVDATADVVSERSRAAEAAVANQADRLALITRVVDAMSEHTDYHKAADALAKAVVPELADWGFVILFDEHHRPEHYSVAVTDSAKAESWRVVEQNLPHWIARALASQNSWVRDALTARYDDLLLPQVVDIGQLSRLVPAKRHLDALFDLGVGTRLSVPLFARNRLLGFMALEARDPDRFDVPSVVTTTLLRARVGIALDNTRLYRAERAAALTLQHRFLPSAVTVADLDTAAAYRPSGNSAEIGGDWYDVFPLGGNRGTMLAVGDVVGHDMSAAATMGQLSVLLRARSWIDGSPSEVFQNVSSALRGMHWTDVASVTCMRWVATPTGGHVQYANLGHPAPFVRLPNGSVYQMRPARGAPLGLHNPGTEIGDDEMDLPTGSVVVLYTDGLVERRDRPLEDGLAALARSLRSAPDGTAAQIRDHLLATLVQDQPEDDVCLLVVRGRGTQVRPVDHRVNVVPAPLLPVDATGKVVSAQKH
ncbi:MAG: SpoIIE family protein phosphatase [Micrococcales bacterium]|nr:SpoIIE family protein phosphatase [Micrococcales bacterium]